LKRLCNRVEVVAPFRIGKRLSPKNSMPKENETSKMKFTNDDDHYFLKFLKINFITENNTFFSKYYYQTSLNNSKYSKTQGYKDLKTPRTTLLFFQLSNFHKNGLKPTQPGQHKPLTLKN
jgi:hypothetical protein